jgi:AraC-like DNA-binding protein
MRINVRIDCNLILKTVLSEQLDILAIDYEICGPCEVLIREELTPQKKQQLVRAFKKYGIEIIDDKQLALVERIKTAIDEKLENDGEETEKISTYLARKLNYSYSYLSGLFSENTFTSIENFIILRKVDLVKDFLRNTDLTLTEIAYHLKYSSVAHLSSQFKKTTGLTPTTFQRLIEKRKARFAEQTQP